MIGSATPQLLPPEIRVEQPSPGRLQYVLPRRPLGIYRWLALVPLVPALIFLSFGWGWFAAVAQAPMPAISLLFRAIGALAVGSTVIPLVVISVAMLWGRSSIEIRGGQLWAIEHLGFLRWGRKRPLAQVRRLEVGSPRKRKSSERPPATSPFVRFAAIRIETSRGKPRMAAIGYPREWLLPLAHELARQVGAGQRYPFDPQARAVPQFDPANAVEVADDREPTQRFRQPADSRVIVTERPGSLTFEIPPAGIRRGAGGLFAFACVWIAFVAVVTAFVVSAFLQRAPQPQLGPGFVLIPFLGVFWLIGVGLILAALYTARWRAAIAVADGRCLVIQAGLFGERKQVWEAGELTAVQVGPSRVEFNDTPVMELQFIPRVGNKFGMSLGRDEAELEWLATRLTNALGLVPARAGDGALADVDTQPPDSDAACMQLPRALTISIPRRAWRKGALRWWKLAVFWNAFIATAMTAFIVYGWTNLAESLFPLLVMSLLAIVGIALIGGAIHATIDRAEIAFSAGRLLVLRFGLFGARRNEWSVEELAAIRASDSGIAVNKRRLMQLQIVPIRGKTVALLTGRADQELAWIATLLRRAMKLPAETD